MGCLKSACINYIKCGINGVTFAIQNHELTIAPMENKELIEAMRKLSGDLTLLIKRVESKVDVLSMEVREIKTDITALKDDMAFIKRIVGADGQRENLTALGQV